MNQNRDPELTIEEKIQANAELVIRQIRKEFGVTLNYDEAAIKWLEDYVEQLRTTVNQETIYRLTNIFGSFVGECIRYEFGGQWKQYDGRWGVEFSPQFAAFPFAKLAKQFENGRAAGDSILGFYRSIPALSNMKSGKDSHQDNPTE